MLPPTALLAPHFSAAELGADQAEVSDAIAANLQQVASWLEAARAALGVPLRVTSGFRTAAHNAAIGGASDSDHMVGLAADFVPLSDTLSQYEIYRLLQSAATLGQLPAFDQLIYYQVDDHVHVGLGPRARAETLYKLSEGSYAQLVGELVTQLRGFV